MAQVLPEWQPLPSCEPAVLGPHMAEYCALEFALAGAVGALAPPPYTSMPT